MLHPGVVAVYRAGRAGWVWKSGPHRADAALDSHGAQPGAEPVWLRMPLHRLERQEYWTSTVGYFRTSITFLPRPFLLGPGSDRSTTVPFPTLLLFLRPRRLQLATHCSLPYSLSLLLIIASADREILAALWKWCILTIARVRATTCAPTRFSNLFSASQLITGAKLSNDRQKKRFISCGHTGKRREKTPWPPSPSSGPDLRCGFGRRPELCISKQSLVKEGSYLLLTHRCFSSALQQGGLTTCTSLSGKKVHFWLPQSLAFLFSQWENPGGILIYWGTVFL